MFRKRYLPVLMAVLGLVLSPHFAGAIGKPLPSKPAYGGTLVWGTQFKPAPLNPITTTNTVSLELINLIFNGLIRLTPSGEMGPDLAERWELSADGRAYTFYLRKGVYFHDGVELTADDVRFSYEQYMAPEIKSPYRSNFDMVESIEVINDHAIRFHLKEQVPLFTYQFCRHVFPKHVFAGKGSYSPVGTGPFRFVEWDRDTDQISLEYNPDYFEGRPYLDRIVVKVYADPASLWSALMRHEVDLVQYISETDYQVLSNDPAFNAYDMSTQTYSAIMYNLEDPVLSDPIVRRSIAHSIDIDGLLTRLSDIQGIKSTGPFHPQSPAFNADVKPLDYDPDKAVKILEQDGWNDSNQDGILEKDGQDLEIRMLVDNDDFIHKKTALAIRQQLAEVGIKLSLQLYKDLTELNESYLLQHKPQAWLRYYSARFSSEDGSVSPWYSGFTMPGQIWKYKNDTLDQLIERARTESNPEKSYDLYKTIHKSIYEEQPACFLFFHEGFFALNKRFAGMEGYFNPNMPTYTMKDWHVVDGK